MTLDDLIASLEASIKRESADKAKAFERCLDAVKQQLDLDPPSEDGEGGSDGE